MQIQKKICPSFIITLLIALFTLSTPILALADENEMTAEEIQSFSIDANAAISVDFDTGKVLYDQDSQTVQGIASITKIIGLYIVAEQIKDGKLTWEDAVPISNYAAELSVAQDLSNVPLHQGVTYTVKELYDASFIQSGNAAMVALAEKIAGSEPAFVDMMQELLHTWGIEDAKLVNASGLNNSYLGENIYPGTSSTDENEMSAKDLAIITRHYINDFPEVLEVTSTATKTFGEGSYSPIEMTNWNWMLPGFINAYDGVDGFKTGTTDFAGACFVGTAVRDGQRIITVVLNAHAHNTDPSARFTETSKLMDYSYNAWTQTEVLAAGTQLADQKTVTVDKGKEETVSVSLKDSIQLWVRNDMNLDTVVATPTFTEAASAATVEAPIAKGIEVATVSAALPEDTLGYLESSDAAPRSSLITDEAVEKANIFVLGWRAVTNFFNNLF